MELPEFIEILKNKGVETDGLDKDKISKQLTILKKVLIVKGEIFDLEKVLINQVEKELNVYKAKHRTCPERLRAMSYMSRLDRDLFFIS